MGAADTRSLSHVRASPWNGSRELIFQRPSFLFANRSARPPPQQVLDIIDLVIQKIHFTRQPWMSDAARRLTS